MATRDGSGGRRRTLLAVLSIALPIAGCGEGAPGAAGVTVSDSAGIEIVAHSAAALAAARSWTVESDPAVRIESGEPYTLFQVGDVLPLRDGGVAVFNGTPTEVLVFDQAGVFVRRLGQNGQGPGEFGAAGSLLEWGDSIAAWDGRGRRLSVFAGDSLLREVSLADLWSGSMMTEAHPIGGGAFVLFTSAGLPTDGRQGRFREPSESYILSREGTVLASLGPFPGTETSIGGNLMGPVLFGARSFAAAGPARVAVATGVDPEVRLFGADGGLRRIVRWPDRDRRVTRAEIDHFFEVALEETPEAQREATRSMIDRFPMADESPSHGELLMSELGELWVGDFPGPLAIIPTLRPPSRRWKVFDDAGVLAATVETPEGFKAHALRGALIYGVYVDELGVESVRAYRVVRD